MNKYKLHYGNNISEEVYAEEEDSAGDESTYPESSVKEVEFIGVFEE